MNLFEDLKIKEQLLNDHEWEYDSHYNAIQYSIGDGYVIHVKFGGFTGDAPSKSIPQQVWLLGEPSLGKPSDEIIGEYALVSMCKITEHNTPGIHDMVETPGIVSSVLKLYSDDYLIVKQLRDIRKPLFDEWKRCEDFMTKQMEKDYQKRRYDETLQRVPASFLRELNIDNILNEED